MSEELKPGDEVWLQVEVVSKDNGSGGISISIRQSDNRPAVTSARVEDISKSIPSESEMKLDANLFGAAQHFLAHDDTSGYEELKAAVEAKRRAVNPSSLEDKIADLIRDSPTLGPEALAADILECILDYES